MMDARLRVWLLLFFCAAAGAFAYAQVVSVFDASTWWRVALFSVIGVAGFLMVFLMPRFKVGCAAVVGIWIPSILLRVLLLPAASSDDLNRYLWEGKLVNSGISPYAQTADAEQLKHLRDGYWFAMNHKDKPTAYPPLTELTFAAVTFFAYTPWVFKALFVLADLATLAAILALLKRRGLASAYSGFYAFNPVVLVAFAGEAHFDSLMLAALVWALWAYEVGRVKLAVALVSISTGIKWITLPLIPFFAGKRLFASGLISIAMLLLPALFFWESLPALFAGLFEFGGTRSFNGPIYDLLLRGLELPRSICSGLVMLVLAAVVLWRWFWRERAPVDAHIRWILGSLIVLSPTVHFWYLAWILPFVCLRPSLPWLTFSLTGGVYFYVWMNPDWGLSVPQQVVFWGPFFVALLYELWSTRGRVVAPMARSAGLEGTVAVVIPSHNVIKQLPIALESLRAQSTAPLEVVIVDAGSTDGTVDLAQRADLPVRVIESELGRGQQIAAGIEAVSADWVLVLHADAELRPDAIENLLRAVRSDPTVIGGALGQRFEDNNPELLPIELLNDLRALFTRTAFGDQVQFFHRETALEYELMPKQPLMEDVESSWRTRECGGFIYLNQACRVCHRKWNPSEWLARFRLIMRLVARYRFARLKSRDAAQQLSQELYREYYPNRK
jgi:hypothetical protein